MDVTVSIQGLEGVLEKLDSIPENMTRKVLRKALKAGGKVMQTSIKERAPVLTGELRDDINVSVKMDPANGQGKASIGPTKHSAYKARFAELGTKHQSAKPFMRPAFDADAQRTVDAFVEALKEGLK